MKRTTHTIRRPIMWVLLAAGALLPGCPPAAVDIGMVVFQGLASGMNSSGLYETLLQSLAQGL